MLRRTRPEVPVEGQSFRARLRRIVLDEVELIEHASDPVISGRSPSRTRFDGGEDIALELMRGGQAKLTHNGQHVLRAGNLWVVDYARPFHSELTRHRASGVVLSRRRVRDALGEDLSALAGHRIAPRGLAAVLRSHIMSTLDEAPNMTAEERVIATRAAGDMTLAVLQAQRFGFTDPDQFADGLYKAALMIIEKRCGETDLAPEHVAATVGCSRATLYRLFARNDRGVAAEIWRARLDSAWRLLRSSDGIMRPVGDVALLCGFIDVPTFNRMFRRRFGMTPTEARVAAEL